MIQVSDSIQITQVGSHLYVKAYYLPAFIKQAKNLRGIWVPEVEKWQFDPSMRTPVQELLKHLWGVDGTQAYAVCTLEVKQFTREREQEGIFLFNRPIIRGTGKNDPVLKQPDIYILSGSYRVAGSATNWRTILENATFQIANFPLDCLDRPDVRQMLEAGTARIIV